jgi:hypothetical protein
MFIAAHPGLCKLTRQYNPASQESLPVSLARLPIPSRQSVVLVNNEQARESRWNWRSAEMHVSPIPARPFGLVVPDQSFGCGERKRDVADIRACYGERIPSTGHARPTTQDPYRVLRVRRVQPALGVGSAESGGEHGWASRARAIRSRPAAFAL